MIATEHASETSSTPTEFQHQTLMITVPIDYKELVSPQSLLLDLSKFFTEVKNSLHGSNASLNGC